jgi:hypothetical protein
MNKDNYPYPECESCKSLEDCKHPDVAQDGYGSPLPPEVCPHPIETMRVTLKKRKSNYKKK